MSEFQRWYEAEWDFLPRSHAILVHERMKAALKTTLEVAADRAIAWLEVPLKEWDNERLMSPKASLRDAIIGRE